MPAFDLAAAARRAGMRRRFAILRPVTVPVGLATDLYIAVYKPTVDTWAAAIPGIVAQYERALAELTQDSPSDIRAEVEAADNAFQRLLLSVTPRLRDWALRVEEIVRGRWRGAVLSATGVDLGTLIGPADVRDTLESFISWNVDLVKDVSSQARKRISDAVFSGLTERKPAREVAREIREAVGLSRARSVRIASDQLNKISASLAEERRRDAGLEVWMWLHSGKAHPRPEHQARDQLLYSDNPALVGRKVDGKRVNAPPERGDRPGQPPYCGCRSRSVLVYEFDGE